MAELAFFVRAKVPSYGASMSLLFSLCHVEEQEVFVRTKVLKMHFVGDYMELEVRENDFLGGFHSFTSLLFCRYTTAELPIHSNSFENH